MYRVIEWRIDSELFGARYKVAWLYSSSKGRTDLNTTEEGRRGGRPLCEACMHQRREISRPRSKHSHRSPPAACTRQLGKARPLKSQAQHAPASSANMRSSDASSASSPLSSALSIPSMSVSTPMAAAGGGIRPGAAAPWAAAAAADASAAPASSEACCCCCRGRSLRSRPGHMCACSASSTRRTPCDSPSLRSSGEWVR